MWFVTLEVLLPWFLWCRWQMLEGQDVIVEKGMCPVSLRPKPPSDPSLRRTEACYQSALP